MFFYFPQKEDKNVSKLSSDILCFFVFVIFSNMAGSFDTNKEYTTEQYMINWKTLNNI